MTNEQSQRIYTDEELRHSVNSESPVEALEIALSLFNRMTLALESIAQSMQETPTVLFETVPTSDGLGLTDTARGEADKEH